MTEESSEFRDWFGRTTGHDAPRPWQAELVRESVCRSRLIRIPTGQGKTLGVLSAWLWHRCVKKCAGWPRRLVWCLPMRVLTEQTAAEAEVLLERTGLKEQVSVYVLMGGVDTEGWHLTPDREAILIGTQDMLLSRALNRGYAAPRARWPMEFGLLNHDALWVLDEVQLMDVGLATTAQLQAFRDEDAATSLRPCVSWWMSATLQPEWLASVDTRAGLDVWSRDPSRLSDLERAALSDQGTKSFEVLEIEPDDADGFAARVDDAHNEMSASIHGRITLVICNTVQRAIETYDTLSQRLPDREVRLAHGRFRPAEREAWRETFLSRAACSPGADRIIVATQVVEAGVDISAGTVVTELAPWSSLVQRFGRCARYGGGGRLIVVDRGRDDEACLPYSSDDLDAARAGLKRLARADVASLECFEQELSDGERRDLYPYSPAHLILRKEFNELFDTTPDLTGADLDIARFIRTGEDRDSLVCWHDWDDERPADEFYPTRDALCRVPVHRARKWLGPASVHSKASPHVFDYLTGRWQRADLRRLRPGTVLVVRSTAGGYDAERGFTGEPPRRGSPAVPSIAPAVVPDDELADLAQDREDVSRVDRYQTIAFHGREVGSRARSIAERCEIPSALCALLDLAGRLHDWGKAHPAFAGSIVAPDRPDRVDLAKAPRSAWLSPAALYPMPDGRRRSFRHELVSALACFELLARHDQSHPALLGDLGPAIEAGAIVRTDVPSGHTGPLGAELAALSSSDFDLVVFLVASHHGKLRASWHASPQDQEFSIRDDGALPLRGVREGDRLPSCELACADGSAGSAPDLTVHLAPAHLGLDGRYGRSWRERTLDLQARYGPATLTWLEAVLRAADIQVSREAHADPAIKEPAT